MNSNRPDTHVCEARSVFRCSKRGSRAGLLILAAGFALGAAAFSKEKEVIPSPPPMAKTGVVSVYVDQPVEISLQIAGRIVEPVNFLIRKPPRHGKLSGMQRTGRNASAVLYTPDPGTGPGDDFFSFAAQSADSPVSAPATVWVRLIERPSALELPAEIDFGNVFLGEREERSLALRNAGGGVAVGTIRPNAPWQTRGTGAFRLAAGAESTIPLVFEPLEERDFSDSLQIGPDPKSIVRIRGSGIAPVTWPKDGLVISPTDHAKGTSAITFANNCAAERTLTVKFPDFLKAPKEVTIPPGGTAEMKVEIAGAPSLNYQGDIEVLSGSFHGRLPLRVFPAPAKLEVSPGGGLKLGEVQKGRPLKGRFVVRNTGGSDAPIEILAPPEILVFPNPQNLLLGGGQELAFEVQLEGNEPFGKTIRIQSRGCPPVELTVEAAAPLSRSALPVESFLNIPPAAEARPVEQTPEIPPLTTANLVSSESHEVEISWQVASPKISGFRIERRQISSGPDGRVLVEWVPWPEARVTISDSTAAARFERLPSNSFWTIRIVPLDQNRKPCAPSPAFQIATQPSKQLRIPAWAWALILAAPAAALFTLWRRRQRSLHAKEDERIARLERK